MSTFGDLHVTMGGTREFGDAASAHRKSAAGRTPSGWASVLVLMKALKGSEDLGTGVESQRSSERQIYAVGQRLVLSSLVRCD